ncbi:hypothetical protein QR680_003117 [Steinernema hermaphroditum]|uniref:Uncharacterized protein n=1 Tax=Steinernema hermaphroditum TaxID=289476 RepID=A0AA39H5H0_9BILA|nr:hypothetical protein QR680_003117 [Steinernema hermaphroditum]
MMHRYQLCLPHVPAERLNNPNVSASLPQCLQRCLKLSPAESLLRQDVVVLEELLEMLNDRSSDMPPFGVSSLLKILIVRCTTNIYSCIMKAQTSYVAQQQLNDDAMETEQGNQCPPYNLAVA